MTLPEEQAGSAHVLSSNARVHSLQPRREAATPIEEIGHEEPFVGQARAAAAVERQRVEHSDIALGVVAVDDDQVEAAPRRGHVVVAVRDLDDEPPRVRGQA